ncbi:MAG: permease prefix domain 1-containing protein, partial [Phycisphaerales bacterium]|nr:permease prefix domain 1-containing protein [Phycisphaerales bacterium]
MRFERWIYTVPLRLRSLFRRSRLDQELNEEIRYHLDWKIEQCIAQGMTPQEARHAALRAMGGVQQRKEECRDMRHVNLIDNVLQDLRHAFANLARNRAFAAASIVVLALGIGANAAMFSVIDAVLLRA